MNKEKFKAYCRLIDIIKSSYYLHFVNGTLLNLINNFFNIYKCKDSRDKLIYFYNHQLELFKYYY